VSLTNNIAEGHGRFHFPDQIKFMLQAHGSLEELIDDLNVCEDEEYLPADELSQLKQQGWNVLKLLNGYLRWLCDKKIGQNLEMCETLVFYNGNDSLEEWLESRPLQPM